MLKALYEGPRFALLGFAGGTCQFERLCHHAATARNNADSSGSTG